MNSKSAVSDGFNGFAPLQLAACRGKLDIVVLLLERGVEIHQKSRYGPNALFFASQRGHKDVTELLLNRGALVDEKDDNGSTALTLASEYASGMW